MTSPDPLGFYPGRGGVDPDISIRMNRECREHDWRADVEGTEEAAVHAAMQQAIAEHRELAHSGVVGLVLTIDSEDTAIPRLVGPFRESGAVGAWVKANLAEDANWTVGPMTTPWPSSGMEG